MNSLDSVPFLNKSFINRSYLTFSKGLVSLLAIDTSYRPRHDLGVDLYAYDGVL